MIIASKGEGKSSIKFWLIADTHFNHKLMVESGLRPKNYEKKISAGLRRIPEQDCLIHLGDVCLGGPGDGASHAEHIEPLKCRKILVLGNHDKKSITWYMSHGWDFACESFHLRLFGHALKFTHKPYLPFVSVFNDDGQIHYNINIHGHMHDCETPFDGFHAHLKLEGTDYQPKTLHSVLRDFCQQYRKRKAQRSRDKAQHDAFGSFGMTLGNGPETLRESDGEKK